MSVELEAKMVASVPCLRVLRNTGVTGVIVLVAALAAPSASAQGVGVLAAVAVADFEREAAAWREAVAAPELARHRARAHKARGVRSARISRVLRIYRKARLARARIPLARRIKYAHAELARAQRLGSKHCLATAIYHEARLESARGQRAVAEVILARTQVPGRPKSVCGVVYEGAWRTTGCQFSFTCDGRSDAARWPQDWAEANRIAASALAARANPKRVAKGATFYHATYVRPRWSKRMVRVARIGTHIFYRPHRGRLL